MVLITILPTLHCQRDLFNRRKFYLSFKFIGPFFASVSGEKREQGAVASVKEGFGFLKCVERDAKLFFHFNEILDVDRTTDVQAGDEFEFTVIQDQTTSSSMYSPSNNRQSAIRMKWLPPGTVQFEVK